MDYEKELNSGAGNGENAVWENLTPERDNRSLGNKIISTPETTIENPALEYGKILPTEPELGTPATLTPPTVEEKPIEPFNYHAVREEKGSDRISGHALAEIDKLEQKLNQDGDLSSFYDGAREMTGAYLKNSFDRDINSGDKK